MLAAWAVLWPDGGVEVVTVAGGSGPVTCAKGLHVPPDWTWETAPEIDVLVYPGGVGTRVELVDEAVLERTLIGQRVHSTWRCTSSRASTVERAREVRRSIQCDPEPPVEALRPARRPGGGAGRRRRRG